MERSIYALCALLNVYPFHSILWILYYVFKPLWSIKPSYTCSKHVTAISIGRGSHFSMQFCPHDRIFSSHSWKYFLRVGKYWVLFVFVVQYLTINITRLGALWRTNGVEKDMIFERCVLEQFLLYCLNGCNAFILSFMNIALKLKQS